MRDGRVVPDPFNPGAFRVIHGATSQSWVDPDDPERLEFEYVQRIAAGLESTVLKRPVAERIRVVHLGGGGLTLPRWMAARRPQTAQIVCEPDVELTAEVRRKIPLPPRSGIKVRDVDARSGIAQMPDSYADAIILDAFVGAQVPADLATTEFFAEVRRCARPGAVFIANVAGESPFEWVKRFSAGVVALFRHVQVSAETAVWKGRRYGNLVLLGSASPLPIEDLARKSAAAPFPYRAISGRELVRWLGGYEPFSDTDSTLSPGPPGGRNWFS